MESRYRAEFTFDPAKCDVALVCADVDELFAREGATCLEGDGSSRVYGGGYTDDFARIWSAIFEMRRANLARYLRAAVWVNGGRSEDMLEDFFYGAVHIA